MISYTNKYVAQTHAAANMFATLFMGIVDVNGGVVTYANCGNEPALVTSNAGGVTQLVPTGPVVGVFPEAEFGVKEVALGKGDAILAFTDGITDTFNEARELLWQ